MEMACGVFNEIMIQCVFLRAHADLKFHFQMHTQSRRRMMRLAKRSGTEAGTTHGCLFNLAR